MTEKTIYIADDGKEFEDEYDCLDYEWGLTAEVWKGSVFLFSYYWDALDLTKSDFEDASYIYIHPNASGEINSFLYHLSENVCNTPEYCGPGLYYYDDRDDDWVYLEDKKEELLEMERKCLEAYRIVKGV